MLRIYQYKMEVKSNINDMPAYNAPNQVNQSGNGEYQIIIDGPLRSHSMLIACSNCKKMVASNIQTEFNWMNYSVYYCFGTFAWLLFNNLRQKDIGCHNAVHFCSVCGNGLGRYDAC